MAFVSNNHVAQNPFELIHCDIWGPYHLLDFKGNRYFVTIVDDCTRFTWTYLVKHKSQVTEIITGFFSMVTTQFDAKITS